jgi:hypothetical protein
MTDLGSYLEKLKDPRSWFDYYRQQKLIGDILLEKLISKDLLLKMKEDNDYSAFSTIFVNAHYHWGIAIENGLKGLIAKYYPEKIEYEIRGNHIFLKGIGGKAGKTHNLFQLAETVGVFDHHKQICCDASNYDYLRQVLLHLSDMIKWGARYPISNNTATIYKIGKDTPITLVYGFHILDVLQPLFEYIESELEQGETISN